MLIILLCLYFRVSILLGESEDANTLDETYRNAPYNDLVRTPRPLRNEDFMGDIIVQVVIEYTLDYTLEYTLIRILRIENTTTKTTKLISKPPHDHSNKPSDLSLPSTLQLFQLHQ